MKAFELSLNLNGSQGSIKYPISWQGIRFRGQGQDLDAIIANIWVKVNGPAMGMLGALRWISEYRIPAHIVEANYPLFGHALWYCEVYSRSYRGYRRAIIA
jgi:hypothetical protein